jgi:O-antigen ligase
MFKAMPELLQLQAATGIDVTVGLEVLCAIGIAGHLFARGLRIAAPPRTFVVAWLLLVILAAVSLSYTDGPLYGAEKLKRFLALTSFALWAPLFLIRDAVTARRLFVAWVAFAVYALWTMFSAGITTSTPFNVAFGSSGYLPVSICASHVAFISVVAAVFSNAGVLVRGALVVLGLAGAASAFVSGSRAGPAALIATALVLAAVLFRQLGRSGWRMPKKYVSAVLATVCLLVLGILTAVISDMSAFSSFLARTSALGTDIEHFEGQRLEMAKLAASITATNPLGVGMGGFTMSYLGWDDVRGGFAHNIFLEISSELGWIGLAAFVTLCGHTIRTGARAVEHSAGQLRAVAITALALFLYMLITYQVHGDLNDARVMWSWSGATIAIARFVLTQQNPALGLPVPTVPETSARLRKVA